MWIDKFLGRPAEPDLDLSPKPAAAEDAFWTSLRNGSLTCRCCDLAVRDLLSLAYPAPGIWALEAAPQDNSAFSFEAHTILTDDFCAVNGHLFVRAVMEFPLTGHDTPLLIGVWGTLSRPNFETFYRDFETKAQGRLPMMFSWLSNPVPPGGKVPEPCALQPLAGTMRPRMMFADPQNPWGIAQIDGLDATQLCDMLAKFGHIVKET